MKHTPWAMILALLAMPILASAEDDVTSLSYISYLERYATVQPAMQDDSLEAVINMPLVSGDRVDTAREARLEIVLADGNLVWVDEYTTLSVDAVAFARDATADRTVLYLAEGSLVVQISDQALTAEPLRIDGPDGTVYLQSPGTYRVDTLRNGGLRLEVWNGLAEAATTTGGVLVRSESATEVAGGSVSGIDPHVTWGDSFARWVEQRRQAYRGPSSEQVDARYARQSAELDAYGSWVYVDDINSWAWQPTVSSSWRPFTAGRWYWTPVGWSWISYEPWGWLPYHYGSWFFSTRVGWVWNFQPYWSPAWVRWSYWPGHIGWSPYGYYDCWYGGYYGYDGYYPNHHGGGGGHPQPPRGDVTAPRSGGSRRVASTIHDGSPVPPDRVALNLNGRAQMGAIDRAGWNVVSDSEFASPHLARVVRPGEVALRGTEGVEGVVFSGTLRTAPPSREAPAEALSRRFAEVRTESPTDVTRILARDPDLSQDQARTLAQPTTMGEMTRRATATRAPTAVAPRRAADRTDGTTGQPARPLSLTGSAFAARSGGTTDAPVVRQSGAERPTATDDRPVRNPFLSRAARAPSATDSRVTPRASAPPTTGSSSATRAPVVPRTPITSSVSGSSRTPGSSYTRPSTGSSSRPVIIPRSSSSSSSSRVAPRSSSSSGSRYVPSRSSVSRSGSSSSRSASPGRSSASSGSSSARSSGSRATSSSSSSSSRSTSSSSSASSAKKK